MKGISEEALSKFVRNELPSEYMDDVEKQLISNGTANVVLSTLFSDYLDNDTIDDLIGEDDEVKQLLSDQKKKFSETCQKIADKRYIVMNNLKFKQMEGINITKEELLKVTERYNAIEKSFKEGESLKDNLLNAYLETHPGADKEEASTVIDRLIDGCNKLTCMYNEAIEKGGFDVRKEIESIGKDLSLEERFRLIVNTLAVVENLNLSTYTSLSNTKEEIAKAIEVYYKATPSPTQADCESMLNALADAIDNNTILLSSTEKVGDLLKKAHKGETSVVNFASEQYDDARLKAGMALALWLEYEDGNIASLPEQTTPEAVAIGAATAVEHAKLVNDAATGKKTVDKVIKYLKILGGVALTCLLIYVGIMTLVYMGTFATVALISLLGSSFLSIAVTVIIVVALMWGLSQLVYVAGLYVVDKAGKVFDTIVEKLRESIIPAIRKGIEKLITWIRNKLSSQSSNIVATN